MSRNLEWIDAGDAQNAKETALTKKLFACCQSILNYKWIILAITILAFFASTFITYQKPDFYQSTCRIVIHELHNINQGYSEGINTQNQGREYFNTQVHIISSSDVLIEAAANIGLKEHYDAQTDEVAGKLLAKNINIALVRGTRVIAIRVKDRDSKWAAKIANGIADSYIRQSFRDNLFVSEEILKWFPDETNAEKKSSPLEMLKKLDHEGKMMTLPSVMSDPLIKFLRQDKLQLESNLRELAATYLPEDQKIIEIKSRIAFVDSEIIAQARKITTSIRTSLLDAFKASNIKVLEKAKPMQKPAGPDRNSQIILSTIIGLILSILLAVFLDSMDKTIKTDEHLLSLTEFPLLGQIPYRFCKKKGSALTKESAFSYLYQDPVIEDAFTSLRTALIFSMPKEQNKKIMVTSSIPGEGKSTVSHLLALSLAKAGEKVLYIELDLRRPSLKKYVSKLQSSEKGMNELLLGQATLEQVTIKSPIQPNLNIISAGSVSPNPTILFHSSNFDDLINAVEKKYDRIIVDAPPVLSAPDAIQISGKMHGIVFVVMSGKVHSNIVEKALDKLKSVQAVVFGSILNQVTLRTLSYYEKYRYDHSSRDNAERRGLKED